MSTTTAHNGSAAVFDVTEATFQQDVIARSYETTIVVDFWAPWCGPCRMLGPMLERLANEPGSNFLLAKLNVDHAPRLAAQYGVQGIPAVKAFRNGRVVDEFVGAQPEPRVRQFLNRVAPDATQQAVQAAQQLLRQREWAAAAEAFRPLRQQTGSPAVRVGLAAALLAQGEGCEAQTLLRDIPAGPEFTRAETLQPLADYLCRVASSPDDREYTLLESRYQQAAHWLRQDDFSRAMDTLLAVLQENKHYRDGEPRRVLLAIFELLGQHDSLVSSYRQKLASVLY